MSLWEAFTGDRPFVGEGRDELLAMIERGAPARNGRLSKKLYRVLRQGLASDAHARWSDLQALVSALEQVRRKPKRSGATALVGGSLGIGLLAWWNQQQGQLSECDLEASVVRVQEHREWQPLRKRLEEAGAAMSLDRCEVSLVPTRASGHAEIPAGSSALLRGFERRMPVGVEASPAVTAAIEASGLLRVVPLTTAGVIARVCEQPEQSVLELRDVDDQPCWDLVAIGDAGLREAVDLLEDRARAHRLVSALETNAATAARESTLHWRWGRLDEHKHPIMLAAGSPGEVSDEIPRLHANDRVWIQLCHLGFPPPHWFVSVVEIGVSGRPQLLNAHEPEGIEVAPGAPVYVGLRGLRRREGLPVVWPRGVPMQGPRRCTLLVLASQRPISLGHLVRTPAPDDWAAFAAQGLSVSKPPQATRGPAPAPPVATAAWTWGRIDYELDPRPR